MPLLLFVIVMLVFRLGVVAWGGTLIPTCIVGGASEADVSHVIGVVVLGLENTDTQVQAGPLLRCLATRPLRQFTWVDTTYPKCAYKSQPRVWH